MKQQLKVAVIGASGIGKNHARWFQKHGCEVVAFVGSSPESVARTQKALEDSFGFDGRGYTDLDAMLSVELPNIVCIATPPPQHYAQAMASMKAGAHVLCEKPLVYDPQLETCLLLVQAIRLTEEAEIRGVLLGTQMQYAPALKYFLRAANLEANAVRDYEMLMETKNIKDKRDFEQIWIDLSPHALSVLQKLAGPGADLDYDSIDAVIGERESVAHFTVRSAYSGTPIRAHVTVRFDPEANPPQRYFGFNGTRIGYSGRKNAAGDFVSFLTAPDGTETELPDLVDLHIGDFVRACKGEIPVPVSGADGGLIVAWQLLIARRARRDEGRRQTADGRRRE